MHDASVDAPRIGFDWESMSGKTESDWIRDASVDAPRINIDWELMPCTIRGSYCSWMCHASGDASRIQYERCRVTRYLCTVRGSYLFWMRHASVDAARIQRSFVQKTHPLLLDAWRIQRFQNSFSGHLYIEPRQMHFVTFQLVYFYLSSLFISLSCVEIKRDLIWYCFH